MKPNADPCMKQYRGYAPYRGASPAVGRLFRPHTPTSAADIHPSAPLLPLLRAGDLLSDELAEVSVGLLAHDEAQNERQHTEWKNALADRARSLSLPLLFLPDLSYLADGSFALLDPEKELLTVSPDMETLSSYFQKRGEDAALAPMANRSLQILLPASSISSISAPHCPSGYFYTLSEAQSEEACFDAICDFADCARSTPLTVRCSVRAKSREQITAMLRGIYRAAVYTRLSLLLEGVDHAKDATDLLNLCHRVFCELSEEAREFNGYFPKGIFIDTPLLALEGALPHGLDFLCFDPDRIQMLLCGKPKHERSPSLQAELDALLLERFEEAGESVFVELAKWTESGCPAWMNASSLCGVYLKEEEATGLERTLF